MKFILVGKSGSGKDFFKRFLVETGLTPDVSCTTRPKKEHETDGVDYHFLTNEQFMGFVNGGKMVQWQEFNGNKYGTVINSWNNSDVFIMNVNGLNQLAPEIRKQAIVFYLDIPQHVRLERILARDYNMTSDELSKNEPGYDTIQISLANRFQNDDKEYKGFTNFDIRVTDPQFLNVYHKEVEKKTQTGIDGIVPDTFADEFSMNFIAVVKSRMSCIDSDINPYNFIKSSLRIYKDGDKSILVDIAACALGVYDATRLDYQPISWSKMVEFSEYPLDSRIMLYADVWERTHNPLFMIELAALIQKYY